MWMCPAKYNNKLFYNVNEKMKQLQGELDDREARLTLVDFLRSNIGLTVELISGIKLAPFQEITLKGMLDRHRTMCVWGRGSSKCTRYHPDTNLLTNKGLISITDLLPNLDFNRGEEWVKIPTISLWNGQKWVTTDKILTQPKVPTRKITTSRGYELSGSMNHPIQVWDSVNCEVIWKKMSEITIDDNVCIRRNETEWGEETDIDEAYLIGLILGDGCISPNNDSCSITSMDEETLAFIEKFPCGIRNVDTKSKAVDIRLKTLFLKKLSNKYIIKRALSYDKEIPVSISRSSFKLKACLQGLFDTDGTASKRDLGVSFCSTSIYLAKQVHLALSLFGIISSVKERKTPSPFGKCWVVKISGYDAKLFHDRIGFRLVRKQTILSKHVNREDWNTNLDVIPGIKEYCQKQIKSKIRLKKEEFNEWRNNIRRKGNQKNLSYDSLIKYVDFFEKVSADALEIRKLKAIIDENFFFDKIEAVKEEGLQNCLDFNIPDGERYWSNGFISHNSFLAAVFCFCQAIFEPNSKIMLAGPTFRTSRFIFSTYLESMVNSKGAELLAQAFGQQPSKRNDLFEWKVNEGSISAIPLNGERIRGFRANVLVIDEFLLMPQDIIENVLKPFLSSPLDIKERIKIRELEDRLIHEGLLREEQKVQFDNTSKMIALSSASFTFENLYTTYQDWRSKIYGEEDDKDGCKYFISQLSYEALPLHMIDQTVADEAKQGGSSRASFQREYCAQFVDESDGYYSAKNMHEITLKDGEEPCALVSGREAKKYIIAIDPSFSKSKSSDFFAMAVMELDDNKKDGTLVHGYAIAGGDLKDHIKYLYYLMTHFNTEMIIIDNAGYQFIEACNESVLFKQNKKNLEFFDVDMELEGSDYQKMLQKARSTWSKEKGVICIKQVFTTEFIRKANQLLQSCIDHRGVWFASNVRANGSGWDRAINAHIDVNLLPFENVGELAEFQDDIIYQTKKQCALIEITSTAKGTQTFDLPQHLKRDVTEKRARKDNYTTLLLGNWAVKLYYEMQDLKPNTNTTFTPFFC